MVNDLQTEEHDAKMKKAERFASLVLQGPVTGCELENFEMHYMYSTLLDMTPEELETDGAVTKKLLLGMVEELHEMLEQSIIAYAAKVDPAELFYWIDDFAGTDFWLRNVFGNPPEEE